MPKTHLYGGTSGIPEFNLCGVRVSTAQDILIIPGSPNLALEAIEQQLGREWPSPEFSVLCKNCMRSVGLDWSYMARESDYPTGEGAEVLLDRLFDRARNEQGFQQIIQINDDQPNANMDLWPTERNLPHLTLDANTTRYEGPLVPVHEAPGEGLGYFESSSTISIDKKWLKEFVLNMLRPILREVGQCLVEIVNEGEYMTPERRQRRVQQALRALSELEKEPSG